MTKEKPETYTIATRITKPMYKAIQKLLVTNAHVNTADYLRDVIRRDLEERKLFRETEVK